MKKEYLKVLVFALLLVLFESAVYMVCKLTPFNVTILTSSIDSKIPLVPAFTLFYYLWYIYLFLIPFILYKIDSKHLFKYAKIVIITNLLAAIIFIFFPTTINRGVNLSEVHSVFKILLRIIYFTDTPNLCCLPSMHCALSYIFIYMVLSVKEFKKSTKVIVTLTSLGIVLSTLFIKQHVIQDALAAIIIVAISIIISKYLHIDRFLEKVLKKLDKIFCKE